MLAVFATAILLSAALLFTVQPLTAKLILPLLGGAPAVWNTCMVFFQAGLLAGYAYAHLLSRRLSPRAQLAVHAGVLLLPFLVLPFGVPAAAPAGDHSPVLWLLGALTISVGLPFFAVSTTGPLLQRWLAVTDHPAARDPYFLYAASNVGSLGGLLAYPLLMEPNLRLGVLAQGGPGGGTGWTQGAVWSAAYGAFVLLALGAGFGMVRRHVAATGPAAGPSLGAEPVSRLRSLLWVVLALVPSSTLLGATQYLTTDLAAVPLLWVVPLAVYLLTFIVAFSGRMPVPAWLSGVIAGVLALLVAVTTSPDIRPPLWVAIPLHLGTLFFVALACHQRLADTRPSPDRLTHFYLMVATGGVLGGAFNALAAPVLFESVLEYPIALVAACFLRAPWRDESPRRTVLGRALDLVLPLTILLYGVLIWRVSPSVPGAGESLRVWLRIGLPAFFALATIGWRTRFALSLAVVYLLAFRQLVGTADVDYRGRTFFGVMRVVTVDGAPFKIDETSGLVFRIPYRVLIHGGTRHGTQALDPRLRSLPTTYYHPSGPVGQVFREMDREGRFDRVAVIGLGVGTLTAYGREGQRFTIFEIDPEVIEVARDSGLFTYLTDTPAEVEYVVGDGRLSLAETPDGAFGLVVLDAFSSDSIPVHLLTRESLALALRKLRPDGVLLVNVTNRYLDLQGVLGAVAHDLGLAGRIRRDPIEDSRQSVEGKDASVWAVMARDETLLGALAADPRWTPLWSGEEPPPARYLWTDDYSNLLSVLDLR